MVNKVETETSYHWLKPARLHIQNIKKQQTIFKKENHK